MTPIKAALTLSLLAACPLAARDLASLDAGWRFFPGDSSEAAKPAFDDAGWVRVDLPHTWNAFDGEDGGNDYRRGAGWYRRHLFVGREFAGRRLYLQFDGASLKADVFVNGTLVGSHLGGFARFRFDATPALRVGEDNVVSVRVDNSNLGIPPTSSDFTVFGGLYRGVYLLSTEPLQVSVTDFGSDGVFVDQRMVGADARLLVRAELEDHGEAPQAAEVSVSVLDASRKPVLAESFRTRIDPGGIREVAKPLVLRAPHLWQAMADPYLYRVRVEVRRVGPDGKAGPACDAAEVPLGIRSYSVDPDRGFILNGKSLPLHGYNRHQDWPDKGWAISDADEAQDLAILLDSGANAVRTAHYQDSQSWYDRCDRAGLAVWTEIPNWQLGSEAPLYLENGKQQLRELIRQNYNHPSIFFWGVGNETYGPAADALAAAFAKVAREEDPSRLSTYAQNLAASDPKGWHTDVLGFNRYFGWYADTLADFGPWLDATRAQYPKARFAMSEYGAGASVTQHEENVKPPAPRGHWHPEEYQNLYHEAYAAALRNRPYVWGSFIWCLFDFASDGRDEGDHGGRNDKGLVTYDRRTKKDAYFLYKAAWSRSPVVHITSAGFTDRTEATTEIKVYSNAREVTVSLNGVSLGAKADPGGSHVFRWPGAALSAGENHVTATADFPAGAASDACAWTLRAASAGR